MICKLNGSLPFFYANNNIKTHTIIFKVLNAEPRFANNTIEYLDINTG